MARHFLVDAMNVNDRKSPLVWFAEIELDDEPYQFSIICVWRHGAELVYAQDSGCSCPSPFEDTQVEDLTTLTPGEWKNVKRIVKESRAPMDVKQSFINEVEEAMNV